MTSRMVDPQDAPRKPSEMFEIRVQARQARRSASRCVSMASMRAAACTWMRRPQLGPLEPMGVDHKAEAMRVEGGDTSEKTKPRLGSGALLFSTRVSSQG